MNETQLKDVLCQADQALGTAGPADSATLAQTARQQAAIRKRRQMQLLSGSLCTFLLAIGLLGYTQFNRHQQKKQAVLQLKIQNELADLKAETEYTLALIQSVNQRAQKRKQRIELQKRLASLTAKSGNIDTQDEQLAGQLYQKAQTISTQADSCNVVKTLYRQIIQTFPNSSYTNPAREKLAQLNCLNGLKL